MSLNLADRFFARAERQPDAPLILGLILGPATDARMSDAAFADGVDALAQGLRELGAGDNVGLHVPSHGAATGDYIASVYALWRCRACVTPLPCELTGAEQQEILETVHLVGLVIAGPRAEACAALCAGTPVALGRNAVFARPGISAAAPPRLDADGFLSIVGRSKEVISVGGMKFFPPEVEAVLERHPAVAAATVFAPRSAQAWQPVHAQLVAAAGAARPADDALKAHCRRTLAAARWPRTRCRHGCSGWMPWPSRRAARRCATPSACSARVTRMHDPAAARQGPACRG